MFQTNVPYRRQGSPLRTWSTVFSVVAALAAVGSAVDHADARGPGGGGFGGGGFRGVGGFSRPSGGVFNGGGMRAPQQRGTAQKPNRSASVSKATANGSGNSNRQT